jgi:hypothetical protein
MGNLTEIMAKGRGIGKSFAVAIRMSPCGGRASAAARSQERLRQRANEYGRIRSVAAGTKVNNWFTLPIRFRFVLKFIIVTQISCGRVRLSLWTDSGAGCADSANHITSSRQALIGKRSGVGSDA